MTQAPIPLAGLRVLDLSQNLAGPYATQILADLGAEVVKVEPPDGDPARRWGPPFVDGESPLFLCANRNKRSVLLDLQTENGKEAVRRLASRSHVFVQAFRTGVIERLGLDFESVKRLRPDVVYLSVTAFGSEGPLRDQPGYDPLMQAYAGIMSVTGHAGGPPTRVGTSLVDMGTGLWAALGVLAELTRRGWRSGEPSADADAVHVTTSLLDTSVAWMAYHVIGHSATGAVPGPMGSGLGMIAPYQAFRSADGNVMIAAGNDVIFERLCEALDAPELPADPRFHGNAARVSNREALVTEVEGRTRLRSTTELLTRLRQHGVPCAPIQDVAALGTDPQIAASGMLRDAHPGEALDVASPVRWNGARSEVRAAPPGAGANTAEVLAEIGMEEE